MKRVNELTDADGRKYLFFIWLILLLPWMPLAPLSLMAFDAGSTIRAYIFISSMWTYPFLVLIVAIFKDRKSWVVLLPFLNVVGIVSDSLWKN